MALILCAYLQAAIEKTAAQQTSYKPSTAKISGHVYRSDTGAPIAKASVSLYPQDERTSQAVGGSRVTRTSPDGSFAFLDLPPGSYAISAQRNGFARSRIMWEPNLTSLSVRPGQQLENITIRLEPAGVITGTLLDEDLAPLAAVAVEVVRIHFLPGGLRQIYLTSSAHSDDQGNFRIAALPPGSYFVRAGGLIQGSRDVFPLKDGPGVGSQYRQTYFPGTPLLDDAQPVEVRPEAETRNIRIQLAPERTYSITGAIVGALHDSKLKPTELRVKRRGVVQQLWNTGGLAIRPDGSYTLRMLPPGEYTLTAMAIKVEDKNKVAQEIDEGFASVRIVDSDVHADIQIGRAGEVRGTVDAPQGFSFSGKRIILQSTGMEYFPADLDSAGKFDGRNIPPGEYTLALLDRKSRTQFSYIRQAICAGRDLTQQPFELTLDAVLDCKIEVADDTGWLSGQVTDREQPAVGLVVVLIPQSRELRRMPSYTLTANTDSAGRYKIAGAIPGEYFLFAVPPSDTYEHFAIDFADRHQESAARIRIESRATQTIDLKSSPIR